MLNEKHENFITKDMIGMSLSLCPLRITVTPIVLKSHLPITKRMKTSKTFRMFYLDLKTGVQCHFQLCKTSM